MIGAHFLARTFWRAPGRRRPWVRATIDRLSEAPTCSGMTLDSTGGPTVGDRFEPFTLLGRVKIDSQLRNPHTFWANPRKRAIRMDSKGAFSF